MREVTEGEIHSTESVGSRRPGQVNSKRSALLQCQERCSEGGARECPLEGACDNLGEDSMVAHRAGDARGDRWSECRCI